MRKIDIQIKTSVILKELAKNVYTIGENMGDDEAKLRHFVQGATDEGHIDIMTARLDDAWDDVMAVLQPFTILDGRYPCGAQQACLCTNWDGESEESHANDDVFTRYEATLYFPNNTFPNIGQRLVQDIHRYMLLCAKAEWQAITKQTHSIGRGYGQDYAVSEAQATKVLAKLRVTANMRTTNARLKSYGY